MRGGGHSGDPGGQGVSLAVHVVVVEVVVVVLVMYLSGICLLVVVGVNVFLRNRPSLSRQEIWNLIQFYCVQWPLLGCWLPPAS